MSNAIISIKKQRDLRNTLQVHMKMMQGRSQILRNTATLIENYHGEASFRNDSVLLNIDSDPYSIPGAIKAVMIYSKAPFTAEFSNDTGTQVLHAQRLLFLDGDIVGLTVTTESEELQEILIQALQA